MVTNITQFFLKSQLFTNFESLLFFNPLNSHRMGARAEILH